MKTYLLIFFFLYCFGNAFSQQADSTKQNKNDNDNTTTSIDNSAKSSVKMKDASTYRNLAEYLKGRVSGLVVSGGPVKYNITIRGTNTLGENGSGPLYVINGASVYDYESADALVHLKDIKSIEVLKDGAGYGTRGGSGVIIITTKKADE